MKYAIEVGATVIFVIGLAFGAKAMRTKNKILRHDLAVASGASLAIGIVVFVIAIFGR